MKTNELEDLANKFLRKYGLYQMGWRFVIMQSTKYFGCTSYKTKTIRLSIAFAEVNTLEITRDALIHEIAHAICPFSQTHGNNWQQMASKLGGTTNPFLTKEIVRPL